MSSQSDHQVPWKRRHPKIYFHHYKGVGFRQTLMPILLVGSLLWGFLDDVYNRLTSASG